MATRKQKQELVDALKFTPRDIEITLSGYGGEIVMGRISEAVYDFWQDRSDLDDYATSWDDEFEVEVPADARFIDCGSWHDVDDICHESGCTADDGSWLTVEDALERKVLLETSTHLEALDKHGIDTSGHSHVRTEDLEPGTCVFLAQNFEKGVFFSGTVRITRPFDPRLLSVYWTDCDGWRLIGGVSYDGEDVEGHDAYSTTGKGMEFRVFAVEGDANWDAHQAMEKIAVPQIEWQPEGTKPPAKGEYDVLIDAPWPTGGPGRAEWTGRAWQQDGVKIKVTQWGLPKESESGPADAECVQCSWRGTVDELVYENDQDDGVCPECGEPVELLGDPLDIPILEGEEMWASEAIDAAGPETWEGIPLSPWWSGDERPLRKGEYEIIEEGSNWPFPQRAKWTGRAWKAGREEVSVKSWRGLAQPAK